ncbi:hypothetical protein CEXT_200481 [Caerostris extrusa]|uniref:Uncharacterized protein n=1 Tax=Caerostris extrusa TaxID=172846 RepID=A0AAV4NED1_CAEEX|nr:hypothetical protein CEXT_200481 [Caerostris extrusa]
MLQRLGISVIMVWGIVSARNNVAPEIHSVNPNENLCSCIHKGICISFKSVVNSTGVNILDRIILDILMRSIVCNQMEFPCYLIQLKQEIELA